MNSRKRSTSKIDPEQRELIEKAQARTKQKKRLNQHFILFLIGAAIFIVLNIIFNVGENFIPFGVPWFVWAIAIWAIFLLAHVYNVYVTNKFLGKDWEDRQIDKLVAKQEKRIRELEQKVEREHPVSEPTPLPEKERKKNDPDAPYNT